VKIAHLLPASVRFPLSKHNGRYEWALRLARLQSAGGHNVTVYCAPGSADESQIIWKSNAIKLDSKTENNTSLARMALSDNHDIYHSHYDSLHYILGDETDKPIVFTQHWFPNQEISRAAKHNTKRNVYAVPPTEYMLQEDKRLGIFSLGAIHHGIDLNLFKPWSVKPSDNSRFIFIGRISPRKGVLEAAQIAHAAGVGLDIVGKINHVDEEYWETIDPLVDGREIRYLGTKSQKEVCVLFQQAKAFLFPSLEPEAFGLVTIEAQACGSPVIISDIGAASELVIDGKTGFIVSSRQQYLSAIKNIDKIDRAYCREFAKRFDIKDMADEYLKLYKKLISK
jgi:glycosyltransferase involved in cell wall biosynthesis